MSRWIDADALPRHGQRGGLVHWKDIDDAPSIDIVRCKECKWHHYDTDDECRWRIEEIPKEDDFCSRGERRE